MRGAAGLGEARNIQAMSDSLMAWIYLRKSRDKTELSDPSLLHKHRRELMRLTAEAGHEVRPDRIFEEVGSGDTLRARPICRALLEALARLPRGHGGALWTVEASRLTRGSLSDRARVFETLSRAGVWHWTRNGPYDLNQTSDLMRWEIETTIAHHELGVYRDRVAAARLEMALEARIPTGKPPYGWVWDRNAKNDDGSKGRSVPDPLAFPIVQALCRDAIHLSAAALESRFGLSRDLIYDLLRNPFICGWPARRYFPHRGERTRRDNGEEWMNPSAYTSRDRWIWPNQPGDYESACTREEWEAIQVAIDGRRNAAAGRGSVDNGWCRDVVQFLGHPGHASLASKAPKRGFTYPLYQLSRSHGQPLRIYIARPLVHEAAAAAVLDLLARPGVLREGIAAYQARRCAPSSMADTAALAEEAGRLESLLDVLLDRELRAAEAGDLREVASIVRQRERYKRELADAEQRLAALSTRAAPDPDVDDLAHLLGALDQVGEILPAVWGALDDQARRQVVSGMLEAVVCRVEPIPGSGRWRREVEEVRIKEVFRRFLR